MGWVVQKSKESAEADGADPEGNLVMFAITPNYIAEIYNRYRNEVDANESGFEDRWGLLSDEQRKELLKTIERYIDKCFCDIDENINNEMVATEGRAPAFGIPEL